MTHKTSQKASGSYLWSYFTLSGHDRVKREKRTKEDFFFPKEVVPYQVAEYDPEIVAKYWNKINVTNGLCRKIIKSFTSGFFVKLAPTALLYIIVYYAFNIFLARALLCGEVSANNVTSSSATSGMHLALGPANSTCNVSFVKKWKDIEKDFSRILTFFIGFFVSLSINRWATQVKMVPHFDVLTMGLDTLLWIDPTKNQDEVKIKGRVTAKELRMTIMRYCFLSWTMCLSRISTGLNPNFGNAYNYNQKRLLAKGEFDALVYGASHTNWREQWATPLLWANKMANDLDNDNLNSGAKVKDTKHGITTTLRQFSNDLEALNEHYEHPVPHAFSRILRIAIYTFMLVNAIGSQDMAMIASEDHSPLMEIILDFPAFNLMKYLLLFGWLKTATDLQNPFGSDKYVISFNY